MSASLDVRAGRKDGPDIGNGVDVDVQDKRAVLLRKSTSHVWTMVSETPKRTSSCAQRAFF